MRNPIEIHAFQILNTLFENNPKEDLQFDGQAIIASTKLSVGDVNNAVDYLYDKGLIERSNYRGTELFNFGDISLNIKGKHLYYEMKKPNPTPVKKLRTPKSKNGMKVFISHSNKDVDTAKAVIQLLRTALNLKTEDIRCTSVDGYRLPLGVSTDEQVKTEIYDSQVLIGLISD